MPVRTDSLADQVYLLLRDAIVGGQLRPGERVLEKKLAAELGISRTPVREALLRLQVEGTVVCKSRSSYKVRALTVEEVREIYETLGILESAAVGRVAHLITPSDVELLKQYNRKMEVAASKGDFAVFGTWNRNFHNVFVSKMGNQTLSSVCDAMRARLYTFPVQTQALRDYLKKAAREHREIIRLAKARKFARLHKYFEAVHWSYEKDQPYLETAFYEAGRAALIF